MRIALLLTALLLGACGEKDDAHKGHDHDHDAPPSVSTDDEALIAAQKTCPVSGEELGSMGKPLKMQVGDKAVFLCCKGCVKTFNKDPQKYLKMTPQGG